VARLLKRRLALAVALLAVLGAGTAVALGASASPKHHGRHAGSRHAHAGSHQHGLLATASSYLALPASQLRSELASGKTLGQIAAATPGKSEAGLVAALVAAAKQRLQHAEAQVPSRIQSLVQGQSSSEKLGSARHGTLREAVLAYLGTDRRTLTRELRSGETLTQVAAATPGKSSAGLRQAILAALKKHLAAKPGGKAAGSSPAGSALARLEKRVDAALSRSHKSLRSHAQRPAG
jgi:hypothetical protein